MLKVIKDRLILNSRQWMDRSLRLWVGQVVKKNCTPFDSAVTSGAVPGIAARTVNSFMRPCVR